MVLDLENAKKSFKEMPFGMPRGAGRQDDSKAVPVSIVR
jgi:hypothetical protein